MRKGQITLFVILGLVLLVGIGIFLLRTPTTMTESSGDAAKVSDFTQTCLNEVGETVLREMGQNGGYLNPQQFKETTSVRDSQVIDFPPQKIVLWHEIHPCAANPNGCVENNRPPLCKDRCSIATAPDTNKNAVSIQEQLEQGIESRIDSCLDFSAFPELQVKKEGRPEVYATIRDEDVQLSMTYPMTITNNERVVAIKEFSTSLAVALPKLYAFAAKLQTTEREQAFLEESFLHLLAIYSGATTELPPVREVELFGTPHYWLRTSVQERIEQDLLPFMNFIQIANAQESFAPIIPQNTDPAYRPYALGAYQFLIVKTDEEVVPYSARIEYPNTPIFLDINGRELLKPQRFTDGGVFTKIAGLFFTQYKFKYTVAFPVIVNLNDPAAFNGRGFDLNFGLEANIKNNHPLNVSAEQVTVLSSERTLDLSDPRQLVNHTYAITVTDRYTQKPLSGAAIQYECDARYYMGETNTAGMWRGKLPYCFAGGSVIIQAADYLGTGQDLVNMQEDGAESELSLSMWPLHEKSITVLKRTADGQKVPLGPNETALLQVARQTESLYEDQVPFAGALQFGTHGGGSAEAHQTLADTYEVLNEALQNDGITQTKYDDAIALLNDTQAAAVQETGGTVGYTASQTVLLAPGMYDLAGTLINKQPFTIPAEERCVTVLLSKKCSTFEEKNFTSWVSGGMILTGTDGFMLTPEDVYGEKNITMYVLEQPLPRTWSDLEMVQAIEDYQTYDRKAFVRPELS